MNLANTVLGSGMLGLPYAYSHTGWVLGTFLLLICGCCSAFALHLLSLCALREPGPASFYSVAITAMPSATIVIDLAVAIKCFGVATSYLIVIGDLMPDVRMFQSIMTVHSHITVQSQCGAMLSRKKCLAYPLIVYVFALLCKRFNAILN